MNDGERTARELVSRLVANSSAAEPAATASGASPAFRQLTAELCRWVGPAACAALQHRALASARDRHSVLSDFQVVEDSPPRLSGPSGILDPQGSERLQSAIEDVMVELLELLGRLIGAELCTRIVEQIIESDPGGAHPLADDKSA